MIVIDLRETYAVGPFIAFLNRVQPQTEATWTASAALEPPNSPTGVREKPSEKDDRQEP